MAHPRQAPQLCSHDRQQCCCPRVNSTARSGGWRRKSQAALPSAPVHAPHALRGCGGGGDGFGGGGGEGGGGRGGRGLGGAGRGGLQRRVQAWPEQQQLFANNTTTGRQGAAAAHRVCHVMLACLLACVGLKSGKARTSLQHRLPAETGREPGESRESNKTGVEQGDMQRKQLTGHASKRVYDWQSHAALLALRCARPRWHSSSAYLGGLGLGGGLGGLGLHIANMGGSKAGA